MQGAAGQACSLVIGVFFLLIRILDGTFLAGEMKLMGTHLPACRDITGKEVDEYMHASHSCKTKWRCFFTGLYCVLTTLAR